ncbi:MAG TPA: hypothetical protein PLD55_12465 [bacterium]|nr:hypothetical protein [bacterium]
MANSDLVVSLKIDLSQFKGGIDEVKAKLLGVEGSHDINMRLDDKPALTGIANIGMALTGLVSAVNILKGIWNSTVSDWINSAQESDKAMKLVQGGIEATGGSAKLSKEDIAGMAKELHNLTNFEDDEILTKVSSPLLTFRNVAGDTFKEAQSLILDMSTVLGQDLQSSAIQVGKALNDPIQGVTALRRVGVQLSEQQEKQVKDFMAVNDVMSAQRVILDELANEFGGQAQNVVDPLQQMKKEMGEVGEQIGTALLPSFRSFSSFMVDSVLPVISDLIEFFREYGKMILSIIIPGLVAYTIQANYATIATWKFSGALASIGAFLKTNAIALLVASIGFTVYEMKKAYDITNSWSGLLWTFAFGLTKISLMFANFCKALVDSALWVIKSGFTPFLESFKALSDTVSLLLQGKFVEAGQRITSGLMTGIIQGYSDINNELKASWANILNDPFYDRMGEALYSKLAPNIKSGSKTDFLSEYKKALQEVSAMGGSSSPGGSGSTTSTGKSKSGLSMSAVEMQDKDSPGISDRFDADALQRETDLITNATVERYNILADYHDMQYNLTTSSEQKRFDVINDFYEKNRETLIELGVKEEEIENQRKVRLALASEEYRALQSTISSGYDTLADGIMDKSLNMQERWTKVWHSMRNTAVKALADILKQRIADSFKSNMLDRQEEASYAQKETTKTSFSLFGSIQRGAIRIAEAGKEIALTIGTAVKYVAIKMWEIGVAMVKFFSFLGPFAPVAAAGAMVGVTALVNKMRKGFASGGYTGDGSKEEEAGIVHKGEVVLESDIVRGQLPEILKLRSLLQKGIKIKDIIAQPIMNSIPNINYQPQMAFAGGGYVGGGSSFTDELKAIKDSIMALNQNLINKNMTANVQITTTDPGLKVRSDKIATDRLRLRGESI